MDHPPTAPDLTRGLVCAGCGYALHGLPVRRLTEAPIDVVDCPECNAVEPLGRDIPVLRTKLIRGRLHDIALTVWRLVLVFGSAGAMAGLAQSTGFVYTVPVADRLARAFGPRTSTFSIVEVRAWEAIDKSRLHGGAAWSSGDWSAALELLWFLPMALIVTLLWRVTFDQGSWLSRACLGVVLLASVVALGAHYVGESVGTGPSTEYVFYLAQSDVGTWPGWASLAAGWAVMLGVMGGVGVLARLWPREDRRGGGVGSRHRGRW